MNIINKKGDNLAQLYGKPLDTENGLAEMYPLIWKYSVLGINCQEENYDNQNKPTYAWKHTNCSLIEKRQYHR